MLCDEWRDTVVGAARRAGARAGMIHYARALDRDLASAERFVLAADAEKMLRELAESTDRESFERARDFCVAPAAITWIEWHCPRRGHRLGFLLKSQCEQGPAVWGDGHLVLHAPDVRNVPRIFFLPITWQLQSGDCALTIDPTWYAKPEVARDFPGVLDRLDAEMTMMMMLSFALLASPRLTSRVERDLTGINKKRRRNGRDPLLSHSEISLTLEPDDETPDAAADGVGIAGRARHHVRAHYRFRRGRIELVRHHMRGNERFGVSAHSYRVTGPKRHP